MWKLSCIYPDWGLSGKGEGPVRSAQVLHRHVTCRKDGGFPSQLLFGDWQYEVRGFLFSSENRENGTYQWKFGDAISCLHELSNIWPMPYCRTAFPSFDRRNVGYNYLKLHGFHFTIGKLWQSTEAGELLCSLAIQVCHLIHQKSFC